MSGGDRFPRRFHLLWQNISYDQTDRTHCRHQWFHDYFGVLNEISITTCCTAIDHPDLQEMLIVVCHESLYFRNGMEDSFINPNQLRANGLVVDTCPRQFLGHQLMHGIYYVPDDDFFILFCLHGCISFFSSLLPTDDELATCLRITLSSKTPWEPYSTTFAQEEQAYACRQSALQGAYLSQDGQSRAVCATSSHDSQTTIDTATLAQ
jgi:hypothetical protein